MIEILALRARTPTPRTISRATTLGFAPLGGPRSLRELPKRKSKKPFPFRRVERAVFSLLAKA